MLVIKDLDMGKTLSRKEMQAIRAGRQTVYAYNMDRRRLRWRGGGGGRLDMMAF